MIPKGISATYHYVNSRNDGFFKNFKKLEVEQFKNQLDYLSKNYNIISPTEILDFFDSPEKLPDNFCVLTFDDGLKDHHQNVLPILKDRKLKAVFAIPSVLFEKKEVLFTHKNHILLASIEGEDLVGEINRNLQEMSPELFSKYKIEDKLMAGVEEPELLKIKNKQDGTLIGNLKYTLMVMPSNLKKNILSTIFRKHFSEEGVFDEFYLNEKEVQEMINSGMVMAGHGYNHENLSSLPLEEQKKEIFLSKQIFKNNFGININQFSYPYGGYTKDTINLLKENGFRCAYTVKKNEIDYSSGPFEINRYDTTDLNFR